MRFDTLSPETIKQIGELQAALVSKHVTLELTPAARDWLAEHGYSKDFGARPMSRLIDDQVRKPLAEQILFGALAEGGGTTEVDVVDGKIQLTHRK